MANPPIRRHMGRGDARAQGSRVKYRAPRRAVGVPLLLGALALAAWGVLAAAEVDLARPGDLVRRGPYAFSRNPMYVAATAVYVGIALVADAAWPLLLLPAVLLATHLIVTGEERSLEARFGAAPAEWHSGVSPPRRRRHPRPRPRLRSRPRPRSGLPRRPSSTSASRGPAPARPGACSPPAPPVWR